MSKYCIVSFFTANYNLFSPVKVHADPLGDCPAPASNSILADSPVDWMDSLMDSLLDSVMERSSSSDEADQMDSLMDSVMERSSREQMPGLTSNWSSDEAEESAVKKTTKRKKKKLVRKAPELTDSEEEEEGKGVEGPKQASCHFSRKTPALPSSLTKEEIPTLTKDKIQYSRQRQEPPNLTDSSADEEEASQGDPQFCGSMRGGAGLSLEEILAMVDLMGPAILGHQPPLKLDELTPGAGNCFSEAIVQQCRRPPINLYLQSKGITISDMLDLKAKVAEFVDTHRTAKKLQDLRVNFEASQLNMRYEGLPARTWKEYWRDMKRSGPWADDVFVQCTAWYLNVRLSIIYVGSNTQGRTITTIDGDFFPSAPGEERPVMHLGYIVNNHYQSLIPQVEDNTVPQWLAPAAIDNTLQRTLQHLEEELKSEQGSQVSFQTTVFIKVAEVLNIF